MATGERLGASCGGTGRRKLRGQHIRRHLRTAAGGRWGQRGSNLGFIWGATGRNLHVPWGKWGAADRRTLQATDGELGRQLGGPGGKIWRKIRWRLSGHR